MPTIRNLTREQKAEYKKIKKAGCPNKQTSNEELKAALSVANVKHRQSLIQHCVEMAYKDKHMAIALIKKILPDLSSTEVKEKTDKISVTVIKEYDGKKETQTITVNKPELLSEAKKNVGARADIDIEAENEKAERATDER